MVKLLSGGLQPLTEFCTVYLATRASNPSKNVGGVVATAGDCTTVPYKQIIIAMGEGAKASLGAFDYLIRSSAPA